MILLNQFKIDGFRRTDIELKCDLYHFNHIFIDCISRLKSMLFFSFYGYVFEPVQSIF